MTASVQLICQGNKFLKFRTDLTACTMPRRFEGIQSKVMGMLRLQILIVSALMLATAWPLPARSDSPAPASAERAPSPEIAQGISAVEARLQMALAKRDRAALEPIVAPGFAWVHMSDGRVDSREVWLANAAQGMALSGQRLLRSEHGPVLTSYGQHTAVRLARVRLLDEKNAREAWMQQTRVFVRGIDDEWQLAWGQGTLMYEGPLLDAELHARYAGSFRIDRERVLTLDWKDDALFATLPSGAVSQIFLASPTEEATRTTGGARLRFTLEPDGRPATAALVRNDQELWRATRESP